MSIDLGEWKKGFLNALNQEKDSHSRPLFRAP